MKNASKYVICFALLILAVYNRTAKAQDKPKGKGWKVPEKEAMKKSEIKFYDDAIGEAKNIWAQHCKSCHGAKGLGDGPKAEKIDISCGDFSSDETQDLSDGSLFWKITEGRKPMPAFNEKLTDSERWKVVAFIRTLKKKGGTSAATEKNIKDNSTQEKDNKTVKKDTAALNVNLNKTNPENRLKPDSLKTFSAEYLELKNDIEMLRKEIRAISSKVDSLEKEKQKK